MIEIQQYSEGTGEENIPALMAFPSNEGKQMMTKLYYAGSSSPKLCDDLEEWDGVGGSRGRGHVHAYG